MPSFSDLISQTLGVVEPPPAPVVPPNVIIIKSTKSGMPCAPPRPNELYEYRINVSRPEYGHAYITAASKEDAYDECDSSDIEWTDSGDIDWAYASDVEQLSGEPTNEEELDEWDEKYKACYDTDGTPKCSECEEYNPPVLLHKPSDSNLWLCLDCYNEIDDASSSKDES